MFAKVPTAPDTLPTLITSRARSMRSSALPISSYQSAILSPKVTGSAWTPWERPIMTVFLCCKRLLLERLEERPDIVDDDVRGVAHERGEGGIEDIGGGEPQMDIAGIRAHLLANRGQERDDVVLHDLFESVDPLDAGSPPFS